MLLLGHLDTVWPLGTLKTMPWREREGRFWGPGVLDMKAGVAMALAAVAALEELGGAAGDVAAESATRRWAVRCRGRLRSGWRRSRAAVLVLEPAQGLACKTARKGVGDYRLRVTGVAAHAGWTLRAGTRRCWSWRGCWRRWRGLRTCARGGR